MPTDDDPDVPGEEEIGQRRKGEPLLVERRRQRPARLPGALDQHLDDLLGWHDAELAGQLVVWHHVHRLGDEEAPRLGLLQDLGEQLAHLEHPPEAPEHRHELAVLPLGDLQIDDVVVEKVFPVPRSHRFQLGTGGVHQHGFQGSDLGGDFDGHGKT